MEEHHEHPISRFLYGDGQIHLDSLSLTSRIAFYALYEAWRLLQDLTQASGNRQNPRRRARPASAEDARPTNQRQEDLVHPDVLPCEERVSTQSAWTCRVEQVHSPAKPDTHGKRQRLMSSGYESDDSCHSFGFVNSDIPRYHSSRPDLLPEDLCFPAEGSTSNYPDLIASPRHHGYRPGDDDDEDEVDSKGYDDVDGGGDESRVLSPVGGVDWTKLGAQLCSIANTFESTFYRPATAEQKAVYEAFQRIRMSSTGLFVDRDSSLSGLAKMVCRQVLLSSIWILLKKVL
jgi:hypothetical protein